MEWWSNGVVEWWSETATDPPTHRPTSHRPTSHLSPLPTAQ
jgi:hypothetical protein